jgi:8-oxo-dGTP diphosphatase
MTDTRTDHANLAADMVLFAADRMPTPALNGLSVLLIERGWDPYAGCLALPGGLVGHGETFEQAARRELVEETGVTAPPLLGSVGVYDEPDRDPRGRVVSVAFAGMAYETVPPTAGDDARAAQWVEVRSVLSGAQPVAFDHARIIADAITRMRSAGWWS